MKRGDDERVSIHAGVVPFACGGRSGWHTEETLLMYPDLAQNAAERRRGCAVWRLISVAVRPCRRCESSAQRQRTPPARRRGAFCVSTAAAG